MLAGLLAADVAQPNGVVAGACRLGLGGPPGRRGRRQLRLVRQGNDERERVVLNGVSTPSGSPLRRRRMGHAKHRCGLKDGLLQLFRLASLTALNKSTREADILTALITLSMKYSIPT